MHAKSLIILFFSPIFLEKKIKTSSLLLSLTQMSQESHYKKDHGLVDQKKRRNKGK